MKTCIFYPHIKGNPTEIKICGETATDFFILTNEGYEDALQAYCKKHAKKVITKSEKTKSRKYDFVPITEEGYETLSVLRE